MLFDFLSLSLHRELLYAFLLCQSFQHFGPKLLLEILLFFPLPRLEFELLCQCALEHGLKHFALLLLFLFFLSLLGFAFELIVLQSHLLEFMFVLLPLHFDIPQPFVDDLLLFLFALVLLLLSPIPTV